MEELKKLEGEYVFAETMKENTYIVGKAERVLPYVSSTYIDFKDAIILSDGKCSCQESIGITVLNSARIIMPQEYSLINTIGQKCALLNTKVQNWFNGQISLLF